MTVVSDLQVYVVSGQPRCLQEGFSAYLSVLVWELCYGVDSQVSLNINPFP